MITEEDRVRLKSITTEDQGKIIAESLNERGIKPRRSDEYNARSITRVMRGEQEDINAEWAIFQHYHILNERKKEAEEIRKSLTSTEENDTVKLKADEKS